MKTLKMNVAFAAILLGSALAVGTSAKALLTPGYYQADTNGDPTGPRLGDSAPEDNCTPDQEINCVAQYNESGQLVGSITKGTFHN